MCALLTVCASYLMFVNVITVVLITKSAQKRFIFSAGMLVSDQPNARQNDLAVPRSCRMVPGIISKWAISW